MNHRTPNFRGVGIALTAAQTWINSESISTGASKGIASERPRRVKADMSSNPVPSKRSWVVWCWRVAAGVLVLAAAGYNVFYLAHECPLDLAQDEAHYWDWSRHLDWSYYSKGPLVAYLIRTGCRPQRCLVAVSHR